MPRKVRRKPATGVDRLTNQISLVRLLGFTLGILGITGKLIESSVDTLNRPIFEALSEGYLNISGELIAIAFTVLIVDTLNERREARAEERVEKSRLLHQLASPHNVSAVEACRQLKVLGWLEDGSLSGAYLIGADLTGAKMPKAVMIDGDLNQACLAKANLSYADLEGSIFREADMREAILKETNLEEANLRYSDLSGASLRESNLYKAHLSEANLAGANLVWANLTGAPLSNTRFSRETILPDGSYWEQGTDMKRFTHPEHPDYVFYENRWFQKPEP